MSLIERAAKAAAEAEAKKKKTAGEKAEKKAVVPEPEAAEPEVAETAVEVKAESHDSLISRAMDSANVGSSTRSKRPKAMDTHEQVRAPQPVPETEAPSAKVTAPRVPERNKAPKRSELDLTRLREEGYITPDMPPSLMSEELRLIKRTILLNAFGRSGDPLDHGNLVLVTSSNPSEGKTFFSINLALSIASEKDVTVLLVDGDFSKPEILNRLGVSGGKGLLDVVADKSLDVSDCLVRTNIPNLVLLPAGQQNHLTTELIASERMARIVAEIGTRYPDRIIIFDSPPVLASSAASVLALYMGQTVFVVEAEKTTEPQIRESLNIISGSSHISLLLNKTRYAGSHKKFASYYGYGGR